MDELTGPTAAARQLGVLWWLLCQHSGPLPTGVRCPSRRPARPIYTYIHLVSIIAQQYSSATAAAVKGQIGGSIYITWEASPARQWSWIICNHCRRHLHSTLSLPHHSTSSAKA